MDVGIPASTYNQGSSYRYTVSVDESYAYIKNALNTVVAEVANQPYADAIGDLYIGGSNNQPVSSTINLSRGQSYPVWPITHKYGHTGYATSDIEWGSKVTFKAPSGTELTMTRGAYNSQSHTYTCSCTLSESVATASSFKLYYMQ